MVEHRERNYISLILLFSLFVLIGCVARKTVFNKMPDDEFGGYQVIQIPNFGKTDKEWVPYDSNSQIPNMVADRLRKTNGFREINRSESNSLSSGKVLLVEGVVTGYNRGCKLCEKFMGFNDNGKSSVSVRVKLIDKTTGDIITDAEIVGLAKNPGFGESRYIRIVDEIVNIIEDVSREKS
jgi:hypothetical protein